MTLKYISHGNTFDGDGTTKDAAASNGGVGAWNDLKAIMSAVPTYGTLVAGDTVNIQSKVGGANVTIDMATTSTFTGHVYGTTSIPIVWKVDDGTVWAGCDGILTMNILGNLYDLILGQYGIYDGNGLRWVCNSTGTTAHNINWLTFDYSIVISIKTTYTTPGINIGCIKSDYANTFYDCYFDCRRRYSSITYSNIILVDGVHHFVNCEYHVDDLYKDYNDMTIIGLVGAYGITAFIFGGKLINVTDGRKFLIPLESAFSSNSAKNGYFLKGFNYSGANIGGYSIDVDGCDSCRAMTEEINGISFDFYHEDPNGYITWQKDKNYPVLNGLLPDNTTWSLKNYAGFDISFMHPMEIMRTSKYYNLTAAQKKITVNFLVKDTSTGNEGFENMTNNDWFIIVTYRDNSTGDFITQMSPLNDIALTSSTATWVPTVGGNIVYGENAYDAYKIVLNTTNSIKQNTLVTVVLFTTRKAQADSDYNFADPDFTIGAI